MITRLVLDPGKFIDTCQTTSMDVTAVVPSGAPLAYAWTVTAEPAGAAPTLSTGGSHATFSTNIPGDYEVTVTATAPTGQATSLSFPLHVGGAAQAACGCQSTELCFNGVDDDCDGLVDCDDPDCNPTAVCVPDPGAGSFAVGVALTGGGAACPPSFGSPTTINSGLTGAQSCDGCSCGPGQTTCSLQSIDYLGDDQLDNCLANNLVNTTSAVERLIITSGESDGNCTPAGGGVASGIRVSTRWPDALQTSLSCGAPSGSPSLPAATWANMMTFCPAAVQGAGCAAGQRCVPRADPSVGSVECVLAVGTASCPAGYTDSGPKYGGFDDQRSCGACSCSNPSGGSCAGVTLHQRTSCGTPDDRVVPFGFGDCGMEFSYLLSGSPAAPLCDSSSPVLGSLTPTDPFTLCCL